MKKEVIQLREISPLINAIETVHEKGGKLYVPPVEAFFASKDPKGDFRKFCKTVQKALHEVQKKQNKTQETSTGKAGKPVSTGQSKVGANQQASKPHTYTQAAQPKKQPSPNELARKVEIKQQKKSNVDFTRESRSPDEITRFEKTNYTERDCKLLPHAPLFNFLNELSFYGENHCPLDVGRFTSILAQAITNSNNTDEQVEYIVDMIETFDANGGLGLKLSNNIKQEVKSILKSDVLPAWTKASQEIQKSNSSSSFDNLLTTLNNLTPNAITQSELGDVLNTANHRRNETIEQKVKYTVGFLSRYKNQIFGINFYDKADELRTLITDILSSWQNA